MATLQFPSPQFQSTKFQSSEPLQQLFNLTFKVVMAVFGMDFNKVLLRSTSYQFMLNSTTS